MSEILLFHQQYRDYCITFKNLSLLTLRGESYILKQFVKETNIEYIYQVSRPLIEDYITQSKIRKKWSARTIRNCICALKSFLEWCQNRNLINHNPALNLPLPKPPKHLPKSLSSDEAHKLLDWAKVADFRFPYERIRAQAMIATFLFTGVRRKELIDLTIADLDFKRGAIFVRSGKGNKDRLIPLNHRLTPYLQEYLKDRARLGKTTPYLFCRLRGNGKISPKMPKLLFQKFEADTGIHVYPHLLRHTFATQMLEGGSDIFAVSKMMGHNDIKTTTIYLSVSIEHLRRQMNMHPLTARKAA